MYSLRIVRDDVVLYAPKPRLRQRNQLYWCEGAGTLEWGFTALHAYKNWLRYWAAAWESTTNRRIANIEVPGKGRIICPITRRWLL